MLSWVWVLNGAGATWVVRETIARSRMFTLFSAVHYLFCVGQRSMVLWRHWLTASLISSQPKLLCGAVTANSLQTSLCLRISISISISIFIYCTPEATCEFIPILRVNGSVLLDRSSRAAYHMLAEGVCTALYMNATGRSRAANHMLAERVFTASYVKLNLAVQQPSLAQQRRALSHFSPPTTTLLAWKPDHSRTESTANDMIVSNSTVKCSSSRPLDKSTGCIMTAPSVCDRSQCMWTSICPYKTDRRPYRTDQRLGISFRAS